MPIAGLSTHRDICKKEGITPTIDSLHRLRAKILRSLEEQEAAKAS